MDNSKPVYIIGDVHGCFDTLCLLIEKLPQKWESQIILTGDLIDRGNKSCEVIDLAISNQFACVLGNHEELMLEYYHKIPSSGRGSVWISNGGYETMESYRRYGGLQNCRDSWKLTYAMRKGGNYLLRTDSGYPIIKRAKKNPKLLLGADLKCTIHKRKQKRNMECLMCLDTMCKKKY